MNTKRGGFTLIELLMVVAVIGVLMALLLPAISVVRAMALQTQCASNLRQVGMAFQGYSMDHDGLLPPIKATWSAPGSTRPNGSWVEFVSPFLAGGIDGPESMSKVLRDCPGWRDQQTVWKLGYGMNQWLDASAAGKHKHANWFGGPADKRTFFSFEKITRPSERILIGDSQDYHLFCNDFAGQWWFRATAEARPVQPQEAADSGDPYRHRGRANYLFVDLHVDALTHAAAGAAIHPE